MRQSLKFYSCTVSKHHLSLFFTPRVTPARVLPSGGGTVLPAACRSHQDAVAANPGLTTQWSWEMGNHRQNILPQNKTHKTFSSAKSRAVSSPQQQPQVVTRRRCVVLWRLLHTLIQNIGWIQDARVERAFTCSGRVYEFEFEVRNVPIQTVKFSVFGPRHPHYWEFALAKNTPQKLSTHAKFEVRTRKAGWVCLQRTWWWKRKPAQSSSTRPNILDDP